MQTRTISSSHLPPALSQHIFLTHRSPLDMTEIAHGEEAAEGRRLRKHHYRLEMIGEGTFKASIDQCLFESGQGGRVSLPFPLYF